MIPKNTVWFFNQNAIIYVFLLMLDFKIITLSSNTRVPTMIPCSKYSGKFSLELPYESYVSLAFKKIHFICFKSLCYTKVHHPACMWGAGADVNLWHPPQEPFWDGHHHPLVRYPGLKKREECRKQAGHQRWFGWLLTLDASGPSLSQRTVAFQTMSPKLFLLWERAS